MGWVCAAGLTGAGGVVVATAVVCGCALTSRSLGAGVAWAASILSVEPIFSAVGCVGRLGAAMTMKSQKAIRARVPAPMNAKTLTITFNPTPLAKDAAWTGG